MDKSNWKKANMTVIIIGLVTALADGAHTFSLLRKAQWPIFAADILALSVGALHFGIFYGIFCLIRWFAKGYRVKESTDNELEKKQ
jgi:hypothetical protein